MVEQLCDSAVTVGREMIQVSKNETRWREITAQMLHTWNDGMASLRSVRSEPRFKGHRNSKVTQLGARARVRRGCV
jgi:serine/threonine-protein kinase HipA